MRALLTGLCFLFLGTAHGAERIGTHAIASAHPLATEAGLEILRSGGNAFDAAVAVSAALAVVEPASCGLGGGGFWLLRQAPNGRDIFVDGREVAPAAATRGMYLDPDGNVVPNLSLDGPLSAGIPGTPAALAHIAQRYGKLPLAQLLAPAIRLAREGFATDELYARSATRRAEALRRWPAAQIFLDSGQAPMPGFVLKQPELAATLEALARDGALAFYTGTIASKLVEGVRAAGGIWTIEDLARYQVKEREPVIGRYNGMRIVSAPPPSSGGIALIETLNILKGFPLATLETSTQKHLVVEALRRAYRDRADYLGDADFVAVPVKRLLNVFYAEGLRAAIRLDRATPSSALPIAADVSQGAQTTHFSVLDADGSRVAATLTLNNAFGAAFMPPGTGVLLNDEMDDFSAKPGVPNAYGLIGGAPNAIAPGKRPLSSMTPTFVDQKDGFAILGTPGGSRIISMVVLGVLEYAAGGDARSIVARPRFHHQYLPDKIVYEDNALSLEELGALERRGHSLEPALAPYGDMQAIVWNGRSNTLTAASDPRGHGRAETAQEFATR